MTSRLRKLFAPVSMLVCLFLVLFFFTQMYGATSDMPAIVNPRFKYWTVDQVWKFRKPYMWEVSLLIGPNDDAFTILDEVGGKTCLGMHVSQDGEIDQYLWATVHVRQNLGGRATKQLYDGTLGVWVYPTFLHERYPDSGHPKNVFGIEINDGTNILWVIFSQQSNVTYSLKRHQVVVISTPLNAWSYREIQIGRYYAEAGWRRPSEVALILLVGATRDFRGQYAGFVQDLAVTRK